MRSLYGVSLTEFKRGGFFILAVQCTYGYNMEMAYISSNNLEKGIISECIKYVYIEYDYDNCIMPIITMKVTLPSELYEPMRDDQGKGTIMLNIYKFKTSVSTSDINQSYIKDQFEYFMGDEPDPAKELNIDAEIAGKGIAFKTVIIGLYKKTLAENNKKTFEGIYKNTNTATLIQSATSHIPIVIEPLKYNVELETINIPTTDTVYKFLSYLNAKNNFYGSMFMYFMDFKKTYLRSYTGKWVDAKDNQHKYIAIDVRDMTQYEVNSSGIVIDDQQQAYIFYVDPSYAKILTDRVTPQEAANIIAVNYEGEQNVAVIDTSMVTNQPSNPDATKTISSDDPNYATYVANTLSNDAVTLIIDKMDVDASIVTPNKEYLLSNYQGNNKYTGRYYLSFKNEWFSNQGTYFLLNLYMGLKMVVHY